MFKAFIYLYCKNVEDKSLVRKWAEWHTRVNTRSWCWNCPSRPAAAQERKWVERSGLGRERGWSRVRAPLFPAMVSDAPGLMPHALPARRTMWLWSRCPSRASRLSAWWALRRGRARARSSADSLHFNAESRERGGWWWRGLRSPFGSGVRCQVLQLLTHTWINRKWGGKKRLIWVVCVRVSSLVNTPQTLDVLIWQIKVSKKNYPSATLILQVIYSQVINSVTKYLKRGLKYCFSNPSLDKNRKKLKSKIKK